MRSTRQYSPHTLSVLLLALFIFPIVSESGVLPLNGPWLVEFEPNNDDSILRVQIKVAGWWLPLSQTATLFKGTKIPIITQSCTSDTTSCPFWIVPGDIKFNFATNSIQDAYKMSFFLTDTGARIPIYSAPYETIKQGCSGQPGSLCCTTINNQQVEYTLQRDITQHAAFTMWASRPNGTFLRDGSVPNNFRSMNARLSIESGRYAATLSWPNVFVNKTAAPSNAALATATIEQFAEDASASFSDLILDLVSNYTLLLPTSDPSSQGFVVPTSTFSPSAQPAPLETTAWTACRTASCSAPLHSCAPKQAASPFTAYQTTTAATIISKNWNKLGKNVPKLCNVLGTGKKTFVNPDFTQGATHAALFVRCDYLQTKLVPVMFLDRKAIDAGNSMSGNDTVPTPALLPGTSSPTTAMMASPSTTTTVAIATASPSPSFLLQPSISPPMPPSVPSSNQSPSISTPSPTPSTSSSSSSPLASLAVQGPSISFDAFFPMFTKDTFNATIQSIYMRVVLEATTAAVIGITSQPVVRIRSIQPNVNDITATSKGVVVSTVVDFSPKDTTASSAFYGKLKNFPGNNLFSFPVEIFGNDILLSDIAELNCITPCGPNGNPAPKLKGPNGAVSCTCECNSGWSTAKNQMFESFVYCSVQEKGSQVDRSPGLLSGGGDSYLIGKIVSYCCASFELFLFIAHQKQKYINYLLTLIDSFTCCQILATSSSKKSTTCTKRV